MTLKMEQLRKIYGETVAVNDLSLELKKGEVLGLLGRNGAGKTTTIKMLLGLVRPESGEIRWEDKPFKREKLSIGYLPEERGLYAKTKVWEQLTYFAKLEGVEKKEIKKRIDYWLERFQITEYKNKFAGDLSKGNQQKVQLIATLLHEPEIIILDEPFSGLDPVNSNMLSDVIKEEIKKGKTIILSSHQMAQIETFCENIIMMKSGNVELQGKLEEIKESYGYKNMTITTKDSVDNTIKRKVKDIKEALEIIENLQREGKEIKNFSMLEPTLHEIFIEKVK